MFKTVNELLSLPDEEHEYIIDNGLLIREGKMCVYGSKKSYKSMLTTIDLAFCLSTGRQWLGKFNCAKSTVLVVQVEIPERALKDRVNKYIIGHDLGIPDNLFYATQRMRINRPADYNVLKRMIHDANPDVVILDCMYKLLLGDVNSNETVGIFTDNLDRLISETGVAIILIHHKGKNTFDMLGNVVNRGSEASLGASTLGNWYDTGIDVVRHEDTNKLTVNFHYDDIRLSPEPLPNIDVVYDWKNVKFIPDNVQLKFGLIGKESNGE